MSKVNATAIEVRERENKALDLRKAGLTYEQIGRQLTTPGSPQGISSSRAAHIVRRALDRLIQEPGEELIRLELERLDMLFRAVVPRALAGSARHAEVAMHLLESKRRLLGLDAPAKVEVLTADVIDAEIARLVAELDRAAAAG